MLAPDNKTSRAYQGLPPQALACPLPRRATHLPPFAYSMWLHMSDPSSRAERRTYFIMNHYTPAFDVPIVCLTISPGAGPLPSRSMSSR